ncbi:MAG TPA: hypothetical protein VM262_18250 [Acidimicrobiales bacterium]|nr:hypothetical protein [Acidimicrobiales bacterium]
MAQLAPYEAPVDPANRSLGFVLVVVLSAIIAIVCIVMAFSTVNTPHSIDGDRNIYSQWIEGSGE